MQHLRISCINKGDRHNKYKRIRFVGGKDPNGKRWKFSLRDAIKYVESQKYSFYVSYKKKRVRVIVSKSSRGNKYLKTVPDKFTPNNLLSLPECLFLQR